MPMAGAGVSTECLSKQCLSKHFSTIITRGMRALQQTLHSGKQRYLLPVSIAAAMQQLFSTVVDLICVRTSLA
jgi:hypothetical protein